MARTARPARTDRRPDIDWILLAMVLFFASGFVLLAFRSSPIDTFALMLSVGVPVVVLLCVAILGRAFRHIDRYLLLIVLFLSSMGMLLQYRLGFERGVRHLVFYGAGIVCMIGVMALMAKPRDWKNRTLRYVLMGLGLAALAVTLVVGKMTNGATNWIDLGFTTVQPSEFVKILLPFVLAASFTGKRTFIKRVPAWAFVAACVLLLLVQRDLGAALLYFLTAVVVYFVSTSDWKITGLAMLTGSAGAVGAYYLFPHVQKRVVAWRNPWAPAAIEGVGYQIVQGLMAIGSGGWFGMGLGLGTPQAIPLYYNDFIFAALCEEFGIIIGLLVVALYIILFIRGMLIALSARESFYAALAAGFTALLGFQALIIIGGVIGMIPLTGITLPFLSYGGSSLVSCFIIMGVLEGIAIMNGRADAEALRRAREGRGRAV